MEMTAEIDRDYVTDQPLCLIGILKGSVVFLADLARAIALDTISAAASSPIVGTVVVVTDDGEIAASVPEGVLVCKVRNGGNFDFANQRWLSTARLTKLIR